MSGPYEMETVLSDDLNFSGHGVAQGCFIDTPDGNGTPRCFRTTTPWAAFPY